MKYKPSISTIQPFWPKPSAMAAAILLLTAPAFQGFSTGVPLLQMTENSSSSLTVLYNGSSVGVTVNNTSADHWTVTLPVAVLLNNAEADPGDAIPEPAGETGWNNVFQTKSTPPVFSDQLFVVSDSATTDGIYGLVANNVVTPVGVLSSGATLDLQFNDLGDGPGNGTVPDGASTALLALPAILALFAMARLRKSSVPA